MIIKWWQTLTDQERGLISLGFISVIGFLGYYFAYAPLLQKTDVLTEQLKDQERSFAWIKHSEIKLNQLRQAGYSKSQSSNEALLVYVERTLTEQKLSGYLDHIQQQDSDLLQLSFHHIPFDDLMNWLQTLSQTSGINARQIRLTKTEPMGTTDAEITLKQIH